MLDLRIPLCYHNDGDYYQHEVLRGPGNVAAKLELQACSIRSQRIQGDMIARCFAPMCH